MHKKRRPPWLQLNLQQVLSKTGHLLVNLGFGISRFPAFSILKIFLFAKYVWGIWWWDIEENSKGVLGRPWTKWMVLRVISSTLKFQFTVNHEKWRFDYSVRQNIGDRGPIEMQNVFPLISVLSKPPQLQYWTKKSSVSWKPPGLLTSAKLNKAATAKQSHNYSTKNAD